MLMFDHLCNSGHWLQKFLRTRRRLLAWLSLPCVALAISLVVHSQTAPPAIPPVALADDPLYATGTREKPTMALALSVEWPTAGAQYLGAPNSTLDTTYTPSTEYIGYYDTESCYAYNDSPTETPLASQSKADYKRFDRIGPATGRTCADAFSGNFLNWSSSSAIDMLRLALSGGDRYIDREDLTILQRAVLPDGDPQCLWNSVTFPSKIVLRNGGGTGNYWGAVPIAMRAAAGAYNIYVLNTLNKIYFGLSASGGCGGKNGAQRLAAEVPNRVAPAVNVAQALPADASPACATEDVTCTFSGIKEVWYGTGTQWAVAPASDSVLCSASVFGDPAFGVAKACYTRNYTGSWAPSSSTIGPRTIYTTQPLPADAVECASQGGACTLTGIQEVWYGTGTVWFLLPASGTVPCNGLEVFGDPAVNAAKKCYVRAYTGSWKPKPLNSDGFFYARVKVCDQDASGNLLDVREYGSEHNFCTRYPSNQFKPTGTIQKYSNSFRLAAFGYALDQGYDGTASRRYGGVLRAPMKWVGSKTYDNNGQENTPANGNTAAEWDRQTGIFKSNPDGDTTQTPPISGVVNYLNKFGRIGSKLGRYKEGDPVGELYYEALRYLQGLPPSPKAVEGLTAQMYDGFPIFADWTGLDPFANGSRAGDYTCLKNNIVAIGDIESHDGLDYARFPAANSAANVPDFRTWRNTVAAFEGGLVRSYVDGKGETRSTGNPNSPNPYTFGDQFDLVGTAYWAHTHDIRGTNWTDQESKQRPGLRVKSFFFDVNAYGKQNVEATRRYKNQSFMAAKYGGFESTSSPNSLAQPYNTWGNPFVDMRNQPNNNVWQDPARPGEASAYALQSNGRSVLAAFDSIFARAGERIRSIAGAAAQSSTLTEAGNFIYQAEFSSQDWSGDLAAYAVSTVSTASGKVAQLSSTPAWRAAERLRALTNVDARKIVIGNSGATSTQTASNFTWDSISADLKQSLNKDPDSESASTSDNLGADRLNFIRGDHSNEITRFRDRDGQRIGDIVNSGVAYSGAPSSTIQSTTYPAFLELNKSRKAAVFVGANDGMLHAFDASNGDELFGYIPSWLGPRLSALSSKKYLDNHQAYVNASPSVAEAQVGSDWKTVLVGGTGAGGRGVFALDVTDPTQFSASKVMWEFTSADDIDLGYVVGRPQVLKFRTSAPDAPPDYKWFAVVASGVNNYVRDNAGNFSTTGDLRCIFSTSRRPQALPGHSAPITTRFHCRSMSA